MHLTCVVSKGRNGKMLNLLSAKKKKSEEKLWVLFLPLFAVSDINKHGHWTSLDTKLAESTILIHNIWVADEYHLLYERMTEM